jgi:hypothetical protein
VNKPYVKIKKKTYKFINSFVMFWFCHGIPTDCREGTGGGCMAGAEDD